MRDLPKGPLIVIGIVVVLLAVLVTDCCAGKWVYYHGTITNHRYVPESTHTEWDDEGNSSTHTDPEEFHLGFSSDEGVTLDIETSRETYNSHQDGQQVWVKARKGRISHYLAHITDKPEPEK